MEVQQIRGDGNGSAYSFKPIRRKKCRKHGILNKITCLLTLTEPHEFKHNGNRSMVKLLYFLAAQKVADIPGVKILKLTGNLNFVNADTFTSAVINILDKSHVYLRRRSSSHKVN